MVLEAGGWFRKAVLPTLATLLTAIKVDGTALAWQVSQVLVVGKWVLLEAAVPAVGMAICTTLVLKNGPAKLLPLMWQLAQVDGLEV